MTQLETDALALIRLHGSVERALAMVIRPYTDISLSLLERRLIKIYEAQS